MKFSSALTLLFSSLLASSALVAQPTAVSTNKSNGLPPIFQRRASRSGAIQPNEPLQPPPLAQQLYQVVQIGTVGERLSSYVPGGQGMSSTGVVLANAFNDYSGFLSDYLDSYLPFLFKDGTYTILPHLAGYDAVYATAINNNNQVAGGALQVYQNSILGETAVLWDRGTVINLGAALPPGFSFAYGLNDHGAVIGGYYAFDSSGEIPVLWQNGTATALPVPAGVTSASAMGINNSGMIVGFLRYRSEPSIPTASHACLWTYIGQQMVVQDLGTLGSYYSYASFINNHGQIAGDSDDTNGFDTSVFWNGIEVVNLGRLLSGRYSYARAMNDHQVIIGGAYREDVGGSVAALWQKTGILDLNTVVPAGTPLLGEAESINEVGEIAVTEYLTSGYESAALLKPLYLP